MHFTCINVHQWWWECTLGSEFRNSNAVFALSITNLRSFVGSQSRFLMSQTLSVGSCSNRQAAKLETLSQCERFWAAKAVAAVVVRGSRGPSASAKIFRAPSTAYDKPAGASLVLHALRQHGHNVSRAGKFVTIFFATTSVRQTDPEKRLIKTKASGNRAHCGTPRSISTAFLPTLLSS